MYTFGIILICVLSMIIFIMGYHLGYVRYEKKMMEECEDSKEETPSKEIIEFSDRVHCAYCGCIYKFGKVDVIHKGWPMYSVYVECPICRGKHFIDQ